MNEHPYSTESNFMRINESNSTINDDRVMSTLLINHKWLTPWVIRVSQGLTRTVADLLTDVEDILGVNPTIAYLRITEEIINDGDQLLETYQRKLLVFIQSKDPVEARDQALVHAVRHAIIASQEVCRHCGDKLQQKDLHDEAQRQLYPFLPTLSEAIISGYRSSYFRICMSCAADEWKERQELNPVESNIIEGNVDFDDMEIDGDDDDVDDDTPENAPDGAEEITDNVIKKVVMFNTDEVDALLEANTDASRDQVSRIKGLVKKLKATSNTKELAMIPECWRDYCCDLSEKFPNFASVIRFIRDQLSLSALGDGVLRLPPLLLLGPPGIGKTEFALTIADDFKTKLQIVDISSSQTGSTLTGSEAYWGNSQPGMLFNTLTLGVKANPIILLDEIDKARASNGYDPLAALYNLLEARQARQFHDLSFPEITLDASHVIWIATANNVESVNSAIIDRFSVFLIETPTEDQSRQIADHQYQRFISNHPSGDAFEPNIRIDVLNKLAKYHPRRVRKILEQAFAGAAFNCRNYLIVDDISSAACTSGEKKTTGMGFLTDI